MHLHGLASILAVELLTLKFRHGQYLQILCLELNQNFLQTIDRIIAAVIGLELLKYLV